jgi:hypothetical protein
MMRKSTSGAFIAISLPYVGDKEAAKMQLFELFKQHSKELNEAVRFY